MAGRVRGLDQRAPATVFRASLLRLQTLNVFNIFYACKVYGSYTRANDVTRSSGRRVVC
jgi:hypothetical protein